MKRYITFCFLILFIVGVSTVALALDVPPLRERVTDLAGMLTPDEKSTLEQFLAAYEQETGHQLAVLTVESLGEEIMEEYTIRVVDAWKLGKKGKDDGLLLFIAEKDRKIRLEVGYGLEQYVTDGTNGEIIRGVLAPAFRESKYYQGIYQALANVMYYINKGEGRSTDITGLVRPSPSSGSSGSPLVGLIVVLIIIFASLFSGSVQNNRQWRRRGYSEPPFWGGGFFGGGGSSSGGGGFSGGGGGFGGGGASGGW